MTQNKLKEALQKLGWRIAPNPVPDHWNNADWYAWCTNRPASWPDCTSNEKPPSLIIKPFYFEMGGNHVQTVEFGITGCVQDQWLELKMYSVDAKNAIETIPQAFNILGAAWKAAATCHNGQWTI